MLLETRTIREDLAEVRALLTRSPLADSLATALEPLSRAVAAMEFLPADERLRWQPDVQAVGELLGGVGHWLSSRGALVSEYGGGPGQAGAGRVSIEG